MTEQLLHSTDTNAIRQKLAQYLSETGQSRAQAAREVGVSQATLSLFLNDTYSGNNAEIARKAEQFLSIAAQRKTLVQKPELCLQLDNTAQILQKVYITHASKDILLIYGPAGCGKTSALRHYAAENNGVLYVEADVTTNSHRAILLALLESMGEDCRGSTAILMKRVIGKLRGTGRLVIIDEAQHLTEKSFDALRALNDKAGVGIVYAGNPSIVKRMYGSREAEFDQVYSRIGFHCPLDNRYTMQDISAMFAGKQLDKECLNHLYKVSRRKGGLRIMVKQYVIAANLAQYEHRDIQIPDLEQAAQRMGLAG